MYVYKVIAERLYSEPLGWYDTYGITCWIEGRQIVYISDVSCDAAWMEAFVAKLNADGLEPVHLMDVVNNSI